MSNITVDIFEKVHFLNNKLTMISEIDHVKKLPKCQMRCYWIHAEYTEESALEDYKTFYKTAPIQGWKWGDYLYFATPS